MQTLIAEYQFFCPSLDRCLTKILQSYGIKKIKFSLTKSMRVMKAQIPQEFSPNIMFVKDEISAVLFGLLPLNHTTIPEKICNFMRGTSSILTYMRICEAIPPKIYIGTGLEIVPL